MPAQQQRLLSLLFALLLAADLLAIAVSWPLLHAITKSLLMPVLMLQLWLANRQAENREWTWVLVGLFFSWLGDMLLLRGSESLFFMAGLLSFLTTHVLYIFYFRHFRSPNKSHPQNRPYLLPVLVFAYSLSFYALLWPHLQAMRLPVAVYCLVITIMLLQALATRPGAGDRSFRYFTMGAALFVLSDSVLAFDKFYASYPGLGLVVMATYGCAQWLIVQGSMRSR